MMKDTHKAFKTPRGANSWGFSIPFRQGGLCLRLTTLVTTEMINDESRGIGKQKITFNKKTRIKKYTPFNLYKKYDIIYLEIEKGF